MSRFFAIFSEIALMCLEIHFVRMSNVFSSQTNQMGKKLNSVSHLLPD